MDDMAYPSYSSAKIKSNKMTFNEGMACDLVVWFSTFTNTLQLVTP